MTPEELVEAIAGRAAGELVLVVGPGFGQLELLRMANPLGLRVSPAALKPREWRLVPLGDWIRERDKR